MSISVLGITVDAVDAARTTAPPRTSGRSPPMPTAGRLIRLGAKQIRSLSAGNRRRISFIDPEDNEFGHAAYPAGVRLAVTSTTPGAGPFGRST